MYIIYYYYINYILIIILIYNNIRIIKYVMKGNITYDLYSKEITHV